MSEQDLAELQFFAGICTVFLLILNLAGVIKASAFGQLAPVIIATVVIILDLILKEVRHK